MDRTIGGTTTTGNWSGARIVGIANTQTQNGNGVKGDIFMEMQKHGSVLMGKGGMVMDDREKVIKGLEKLRNDLGYGLPDRSNVVIEYLNSLTDAITLLKEQEPKRVEWSTGRAHCPSCGELFPKKKDMTLYTRFCSFCGQAVKWE